MTIERLRWWLVTGAVVLLLVIGGFLGYARYRARRLLTALPALLGADIQQSTNGFTYSQSIKGKTMFTIHATKAVQRRDGKITLHDAGIVLYGAAKGDGPAKSGRADRISGSEFEYDKESGVMRALGEVHIDLQAPPQQAANAVTGDAATAKEHVDAGMIHVKTSGLVFLQKLGVAATDERIEFEFKEMQGEAQGAEYDADTGVLLLRRDVRMHGMQNGKPMTLVAASAAIDRNQHRTELQEAKLTSPEQTVQAHVAHVAMRDDGSPQQIALDGDVQVWSATEGDVDAPHAVMEISTSNRVNGARLFGGLKYVRTEKEHVSHGTAAEARVGFDGAGHAREVNLAGQVRMETKDMLTGALAKAGESVREVAAERVHLQLAAMANGRTAVTEAEAQGGAKVSSAKPVLLKTGAVQMQRSSMAADVLTAHGAGSGRPGGALRVSRVEGRGHTVLESWDGSGGMRRSSGDRVEIVLRGGREQGTGGREQKTGNREQGTAGRKQGAGGGGDRRSGDAGGRLAAGSAADGIESAVQTGHVVIVQVGGAAKGSAGKSAESGSDETTARAERAEYDGLSREMVLTGAPVVEQGGTRIESDRIRMLQASGDAFAEGAVKATYVAANSDGKGPAPDAMHVIAERARLSHADGKAVFTGGVRPARLWQGASQVESAVIEMEQAKQRLLAHAAAGSGDSSAVRAVFVRGAGNGKDAKSGLVRIRSRELVYADHKAQFTGGVEMQSADGTIRADRADAVIREKDGAAGTPAGKSAAGLATSGIGGGVESVVAVGGIRIEQPGRVGTGERLTYSAAKGEFELTGTPGRPPVVTDAQRGATTGASLLFRTGDDSVVVAGADGKRVRTDTRMAR